MKNFKNSLEVGTVVGAKQYFITLDGAPSARINSLLINAQGHRAMVTSFDAERITALLLDRVEPASGDEYFLQDRGLMLPQEDQLIGRIVNPLGQALDERDDPALSNVELPFDVVASNISAREEITEQLVSGVALIDLLLPIGKGQRELIIGPPRSGKTTFVLDAIINQKDNNIVCIYTSMGKPSTSLRQFTAHLHETGADKHTVVVAAYADDPAPLVAIAPVFAFAIAERFRERGGDVLLILDDLATHAKQLREIALLSGRVPGRESYPGDIFYQHAHLMERSGNFNEAVGGGSITLLPMLETELESITNLIPTNAMASTDGHIFFSPHLRAQGYYPSASYEQSVTRVGKQTQYRAQKELADRLLALLADAEIRSTYSRFGEELSTETRRILTQASSAKALLRQEAGEHIHAWMHTALLALIFSNFFDERTQSFAEKYKKRIVQAFTEEKKLENVRTMIESGQSLSELLSHLNEIRYIIETACRGKKKSKKIS
jgi:F-type H+/Na+-transporting ATPase subunit alpha